MVRVILPEWFIYLLDICWPFLKQKVQKPLLFSLPLTRNLFMIIQYFEFCWKFVQNFYFVNSFLYHSGYLQQEHQQKKISVWFNIMYLLLQIIHKIYNVNYAFKKFTDKCFSNWTCKVDTPFFRELLCIGRDFQYGRKASDWCPVHVWWNKQHGGDLILEDITFN